MENHCVICDSLKLVGTYDYGTNKSWVICQDCLWHQKLRSMDKDLFLKDFSANVNYAWGVTSANRSEISVDSQVKAKQARLDFLSRFVCLEGARLLDFGSGIGPLLSACGERGLNCAGIEISQANREYSISKGNTVYEKIQDLPRNDEFDIINLEMCVIYFWDPMEIFKQLVARLKVGGYMIWQEKDYFFNGFNVLNNLRTEAGLQYSSKPAHMSLMHFLGMDCIHYVNKLGTFDLIAIKRGEPDPKFKHSYLLFLTHYVYLKMLCVVDPVLSIFNERLLTPVYQRVFMPMRSLFRQMRSS